MNPARWGRLHFAWRGWILAGLLAALAFARYRSQAPLQPAWLVLLALGMAWRAWAGFHIDGHSNGSSLSGPSLASGGPYRLSRHPLYFANLLCGAGILFYAHCLPFWASLAGLSVAAAHHEALARSEERFLLARHGTEYRGYMQVTPRWPGVGASLRFSAGSATGKVGGWQMVLARQGWNLAKACACALFIRLAAAASG